MKLKRNPLDIAERSIHHIICPECQTKQAAYVYETVPFPSYVHSCHACGHTIGESEWNQIGIGSEILTAGASFIDQVPHDEKVMALSWNQPYASLMLHGKQETRGRATNVRGWVLICSCKTPYLTHKIQEISGHAQRSRIEKVVEEKMVAQNLGEAIAIGKLTGCRPMTRADEDLCFVQFKPAAGLWIWIFEEVHPIKPFIWHGKQGWKELTLEDKKKIQIR
jgi:hypothetical protein